MSRNLKPKNDNPINSPDFEKLGRDALDIVHKRWECLFGAYKDAEEFARNNHPVQTRVVLFEKFSAKTEQRRLEKFNKEIFFQPRISEEDAKKILEERRKRVINLIGVRDLTPDMYDKEFLRVTNMDGLKFLNPYENNDPNSMWLDICELF